MVGPSGRLVAALLGCAVLTSSCGAVLMVEFLNGGDRAVRIEVPRQGDSPCDVLPGRRCLVKYALQVAVSDGSHRWEYQMPRPRFSSADSDLFLERRGFYGPDVLPVRIDGSGVLTAMTPRDVLGRVSPRQPTGFPVHPLETRR
jgi:hypothetical protein